MKRIFAIIFAILISLQLSVFAFAEEGEVLLDTTNSTIVVQTPDNITAENGIVYGMPESDFKEYMISNNMVLYGSYSNNLFVFNLSRAKTSFSGEVVNFFDMEDDAVLAFAHDFVQNKDGIATVNDIKYVISKSKKETDNVTFSTVQYITVKNSELYVLTVNVPGEINNNIAEKIDDLLERITINKKAEKPSISSYLTISLVILLILVILAVIILVAVSIIKDLRKK
jgi:hypothetical protein